MLFAPENDLPWTVEFTFKVSENLIDKILRRLNIVLNIFKEVLELDNIIVEDDTDKSFLDGRRQFLIELIILEEVTG